MLRVITLRSAMVTALALALTLFHFFVNEISVPFATTVHGVVAPALGLLLVFRTNQSYDRWWEGRKLWGAMLNTCRNIARSTSVHLEQDSVLLDRILRLVQNFPAATMATLRHTKWQEHLLHTSDLAEIGKHAHVPLAICQRITALLDTGRKDQRYGEVIFASLDANCQQLVDIVGACERIHRTPLPFAYVVHLRRALVIYCSTLPFALLSNFGWATVPVVFAVSYVLFGIEEIGVEIEDPFEGDENDLPLEDITKSIQKSVQSYLSASSTKNETK
jgi:ion channel-forming bestrophin family protein